MPLAGNYEGPEIGAFKLHQSKKINRPESVRTGCCPSYVLP